MKGRGSMSVEEISNESSWSFEDATEDVRIGALNDRLTDSSRYQVVSR